MGRIRKHEVAIVVRAGLSIAKSQIDEATLEALRSEFTYTNPLKSKLRRLGKWSGHVPSEIAHYAETEERIEIPRGGAVRVEKILARGGLVPAYRDRRLDFAPREHVLGASAKLVDLRPSQVEMVESAIARETAVIRAATGSGKTEAALEIVRRLGRPALIVVWTTGLVRQWIDRVRLRFGWRDDQIGLVASGTARIRPVTIALQQSLYKRPELVAERFGVFVMDEAQRASAATYRSLVAAIPARYRIAFSADERRKDGMEWLIWDNFGPVAAEVSRKDLVKAGALCEVDVVLVPTGERVEFLDRAGPELRPVVLSQRYADVSAALAGSRERNALAASIAAREAGAGRSTIVFCNRIADGQVHDLARRIAIDHGTRCGVMVGGPEHREEYEETKRRLLTGELRCAVASSAAYHGEDVPRLEVGVVVTPTAGNKQLFEQQVGRLRRTFPGKVRGTIYVLWDQHVFPSHRRNLEDWYGSRLVTVAGKE